MIVVTHEIGFAREAADRIAVMADGTIREIGPSSQVLSSPTDPRTQAFLSGSSYERRREVASATKLKTATSRNTRARLAIQRIGK